MDGVDFFPTRANVLAGFQLRSISLDVIISPIIAVQFGWLPAVLWLLIGAIFFGWIQDYLSTIISVRASGKSFPQLFEAYFNSTSRTLIYIFLMAYLLIIISQFSILLSSLLSRDDTPFAIVLFVLVSIFAGFLIYRTRVNLVITSILSVAIAVIGIWAGSSAQFLGTLSQINKYFVDFGMVGSSGSFFGGLSWQLLIALSAVFFICYLGSILPSWRFSVPFNYVSNWIVILGFSLALFGLTLGTLKGEISASFEIPPIVTINQQQIGPLWPILFVTLSSGAVSGWHALVSSYSTSHQVEKEPLVKPITTIATYGETIIVSIIIIFAATFGVSSGIFNPDQNFTLTSGPASVFAIGFAKTWHILGVSEFFGASISAILFTLMGLSVLQLVVRYARIIISELFGKRFHLIKNPHIGTIIVLFISLFLVLIGLREWLWVLFAGANQLLASLVLIFATIWLAEQNKSTWWTFLPSIFLFFTGLAAIIYSSIYQPFLSTVFSNAIDPDGISLASIIMLLFAGLVSASAIYIYLIGIQKFRRVRLNSTIN
jgi:carbon starvation protein